jgi:hypothetical protein
MSDQQRTSKAARAWLIFKITHVKTRNCDTRFRKLGSATMLWPGEAKSVLENDGIRIASFRVSSFEIRLPRRSWTKTGASSFISSVNFGSS